MDVRRGYKEINYRAMKAPAPGGIPCHHLLLFPFYGGRQVPRHAESAAADAAVELRLIEARQQGPDHRCWNVPETDYLKFYLFQVV